MATPSFRIGSLLLSRKVINCGQLRQALRLQCAQPHKRIGQILLELRCLSAATLRHHLRWQKRLRAIAILVALLGMPMDAVVADPFDRIDWRSTCEPQQCTQTQQTASPKLVIDLGLALDRLKELIPSPYSKGETAPDQRPLNPKRRLRFNFTMTAEQPGFELEYRF